MHAWVLDVEGMYYERCNARVSETLQNLNGIIKVVLDSPQRRSTPVLVVAHKPLARAEVESAIETAGFRCLPVASEK